MEITRHIPEINEIVSEELKNKVVKIFEKALDLGKWSYADLYKMPFTLLIEGCPMNMIEHIRGVTNICIKSYDVFADIYGDRNPLDRDVLIASALLHDIGKLVEYSIDDKGKFYTSRLGKLLRHPFSGVGLCYEFDLDPKILNAIAYHSKEGNLNKRSPEGVVVFHADFINFEPFHN